MKPCCMKDCSSKETPAPRLASAFILVVVSTVVEAVRDGEVGRTFVLSPVAKTWQDASDSCRDMGGTLAKVDTFYVIPDMGYAEGWTLWVGLKVNSSEASSWADGTKVSWTNWQRPVVWQPGDQAVCAAAVTSLDRRFVWLPEPCDTYLPSLCEIPGGECRFNVTYHASLTAYNSAIESLSREQCKERCRTMRTLDCRSLEAHRDSDYCQLSNETRWTHPEAFALAERYWDYLHWTCMNGTYLNGVRVSPNDGEFPSTTTEAATTVTTESTTEEQTSEAPASTTEETVCVKVKPPTKNETEEIKKEVEELQNMSQVYKEQSKLKKKTSRPDTRRSAATVGSLAVGLVVSIMLLIVLSDIISCPQHLRRMNKKGAPCGRWYKRMKKRKRRQQSQKAMQFTEYTEAHDSQVGPFLIAARFPQNFQPQNIHVDQNVEHVYSNGGPPSGHGQPQQGDQKLEQHLERIRRMEKEFGGGLRKTRMAVSCPDLDHMDTVGTLSTGDAEGESGGNADGDGSPMSRANSKTKTGSPRVRVMRLGACKPQQGSTSRRHDEDQAHVESITPYDSESEFKRSDSSESLQSETNADIESNLCLPKLLQNGQVPVLNTSKLIELSELNTLLHSQHTTEEEKDRFPPIKTFESSSFHTQAELNCKNQDSDTFNKYDTRKKSKNSAAALENVNPNTSSTKHRPHVEIRIEEDHTASHEELLPGPLDVDTRLLQVQEFPRSADLKHRVRGKHSKETSPKILNTK